MDYSTFDSPNKSVNDSMFYLNNVTSSTNNSNNNLMKNIKNIFSNENFHTDSQNNLETLTTNSSNFLNSVSSKINSDNNSNISLNSLNSVSSKILDCDAMNYSVKLSFSHTDFDCMILVGFSFLDKRYNFSLIIDSNTKTLNLASTDFYEPFDIFKTLANNLKQNLECEIFKIVIDYNDFIKDDLIEMFENINFDLNNIIDNFY